MAPMRDYLDPKVQYWSAREVGDLDKAAAIADQLGPVIRRMNPKGMPMTTTARTTSPFSLFSSSCALCAPRVTPWRCDPP